MPNKFPAFQLYAKEFVSDRNVLVMNTKEVGAYFLLICACWIEGDLPNDIHDLAATARMPLKEFTVSWQKRIARCFILDEKKDVFFHPRLRKEIRKQKGFRKQQSDAGKESARKRAEQKKLKAEQEANERSTSVGENPSFLIPIPDSGQEDISIEISQEREDAPAPDASAFGVPVQRPPKESLFNHPVIVAFRTVTKLSPPAESWRLLVDKLGEKIDVAKLGLCYAEWVASGNKSRNFNGVADWYLGNRKFTANGVKQKPVDVGKYNSATEQPFEPDPPCRFCGKEGCFELHRKEVLAEQEAA